MNRTFLTLLSCFLMAMPSFGQNGSVPTPNDLYGPGVAFNTGLANLEVGKFTPARVVDYRFRAKTTDSITSIVWFSKHGTGYSAGTGGSMLFQIETDNGTANHFPSGTVLGSTTDPSPISTVFTTEMFSPAVAVTSGTLYHLVFSNTDGNPQANYVSVDDTTSFSGSCNPMQYNSADTDLAVLENDTLPWVVACSHYPILSVNYTGGFSQGSGYVDALVLALFTINGNNKARETFTVSGGNRNVYEVWVNVQKLGTPTAGLTVRLETTGGTQIEQVVIPSSQITANGITNGTGAWAHVALAATDLLTNGASYNIIFSDTTDANGSGNGYSTYPIQDGVPTFAAGTVYSDGHYQNTSDGTTWVNLNSSTHYHLCWFLRTPPVVSTTFGAIFAYNHLHTKEQTQIRKEQR